MIGQKLIKILQTLDPTAFRRLGDAIASPYFTGSPLLLQLYALLKKEYPDFDPARLSKEKVFQKLYPGKPFNDGALRVLVREFSSLEAGGIYRSGSFVEGVVEIGLELLV